MTAQIMPVRAVLSLGANLGNRLGFLQGAVDALAAQARVVAVSPVYESSPVGGPAQPDYLNAVVLMDTDENPVSVLLRCHEIEQLAGRVRGERWGPRVLDIDVISYDDLESDDPTITLPHPRAAERMFVLQPWLDVDPDAQLAGVDIADLARTLGTAGLIRRDDLVLFLPSSRL